MAKYTTDFNGYSTGAQPSDWTTRFETADTTWSVIDPGASPTDHYVRHTNTAVAHPRALSWDSIDSDADRDDVDVLARVWFEDSSSFIGILVRGVGVDDGYHIRVAVSPTIRGVDGSPVAYLGGALSTSTWYWVRLRVNGSDIRSKIWPDGDDEAPEWDYVFTDSSETTAGWVGILSYVADTGTENRCSYFSVGTNGDSPDVPSYGVRVTQNAISVPVRAPSELRVTQSMVYAAAKLDAELRVTQAGLMVMHQEESEAYITQAGLLVLATGNPCITQWAQAWTITRLDGTIERYTTLDIDLTYGGQTYLACGGFSASASENGEGLGNVGSMELTGVLSSDHIDPSALLAGVYNGADVEVWVIPVDADTGDIPFRLIAGVIGRVTQGLTGFTAELLTPSVLATQRNITDVYSAECRYHFGDSRCAFDASSLEVPGTVTSVSTPTAPNVGRKRVFGDTGRGEDAGYFDRGTLTWVTGDNAGIEVQVSSFFDQSFTIWDVCPYRIQIGDTYTARPGCDKSIKACKTKFNNFENFGGFPDIPGNDIAVKTWSK